jgi:hypothetical protein
MKRNIYTFSMLLDDPICLSKDFTIRRPAYRFRSFMRSLQRCAWSEAYFCYIKRKKSRRKKIGWLARKRNKIRKTIRSIPVPWANGQLVQSKIAPTIEQQG